jgi:RNA polymerase sigma-70 factor (ECF subfamily)
MSPYSVRLGTEGEADLTVWVDSKPFCLKQGTLKLDQKITQLYEQWRGSVYRYLILVTGNFAEAEEVTQETFLQLYRCLLKGQDIENVRSWIFRVAHNCAINQRANRKYLVSMDSESWDKLFQLRQDPNLDPEQSVLEQESHQQLQRVFRMLSPLQQQCLLLRAEGFRYEQIAEILNIGLSNVAQSLHRSIKKLMRDRNE